MDGAIRNANAVDWDQLLSTEVAALEVAGTPRYANVVPLPISQRLIELVSRDGMPPITQLTLRRLKYDSALCRVLYEWLRRLTAGHPGVLRVDGYSVLFAQIMPRVILACQHLDEMHGLPYVFKESFPPERCHPRVLDVTLRGQHRIPFWNWVRRASDLVHLRVSVRGAFGSLHALLPPPESPWPTHRSLHAWCVALPSMSVIEPPPDAAAVLPVCRYVCLEVSDTVTTTDDVVLFLLGRAASGAVLIGPSVARWREIAHRWTTTTMPPRTTSLTLVAPSSRASERDAVEALWSEPKPSRFVPDRWAAAGG